jgi:hypothetical protein
MRRINYLFYIFFTITLLGCKTSERIKAYDLIAVLKQAGDSVKFNFCEEIKEDWDTIIILPPYTTDSMVEKQKLSNWENFKDEYGKLSPNDGVVTLLFLNENKITRYSIVPRLNIDMSGFNKNESSLPVIYKSDCNHIKLKRSKDVLMLAFD